MWEFAPGWSKVRMTQAQVRKYIKDMKKAQEMAKAKLENAKKNWEFEIDEIEIANLEKELDNL